MPVSRSVRTTEGHRRPSGPLRDPRGPAPAEGGRGQVRPIDESALSRAEFASRIGTSTSRLSTYATGKVIPSAALLVRMRSVAGRSQGGGARQMRQASQRERAGRALPKVAPPTGAKPNWEERKRVLDERMCRPGRGGGCPPAPTWSRRSADYSMQTTQTRMASAEADSL